MWDDMSMYSRFFLKNFFLNEFFSNFFNFYLSLNFFLFSKFFNKNVITSREKFFKPLRSIDLTQLQKPNKFYETGVSDSLNGRVWLAFVSGWCVVAVFLYTPKITLDSGRGDVVFQKSKVYQYLNKFFFYKHNYSALQSLSKLGTGVF